MFVAENSLFLTCSALGKNWSMKMKGNQLLSALNCFKLRGATQLVKASCHQSGEPAVLSKTVFTDPVPAFQRKKIYPTSKTELIDTEAHFFNVTFCEIGLI